MKFSLSFATLALLLASNAQARTSFSQRDSFNIAFRDFEVSKEKADVIEISLEKDKSIIDQLHRNGKKVICYFSGGTVETYSDYFKEYKSAGILKNRYSAWSDEYWIDYRKPVYKSLIKQRIRTAVQKGCDAIDVDKVDGYQVKDVKKWDNPLSKNDAIEFTSWLGRTAHEMGISIGLKNCLDIVDTVGKYYDFCVNERCAEKGECHWYKNYLKTGKPVFSISYGGMSESRRKTTCKNINGLPIYVVVKSGEKLEQKTVPFDPHKDCGSSYHAEKVSPPVVEEPKKITPAKTATIKKTTTVKKTNPVNVPKSVNKPVTPSNSKPVTPGNSKVVTPSNKVVTPGNSMVVTPGNSKVVTPGAPVKQTEKSAR